MNSVPRISGKLGCFPPSLGLPGIQGSAKEDRGSREGWIHKVGSQGHIPGFFIPSWALWEIFRWDPIPPFPKGSGRLRIPNSQSKHFSKPLGERRFHVENRDRHNWDLDLGSQSVLLGDNHPLGTSQPPGEAGKAGMEAEESSPESWEWDDPIHGQHSQSAALNSRHRMIPSRGTRKTFPWLDLIPADPPLWIPSHLVISCLPPPG